MNKKTYKSGIIKLHIFLINLVYILNCIFYPPAKPLAVIWTCAGSRVFSPSYDAPFILKISVMVFGYCFYCGIADAIYSSNKKRYVNYKTKILLKKVQRLKKIYAIKNIPYKNLFKRYKDAIEINKLLYPKKKIFISSYSNTILILKELLDTQVIQAEGFAEKANNAKDEHIFLQETEKCLEILEWMAQFEKFDVFAKDCLPSNNIEDIKNNIPLCIEKIRNRYIDFDNMEGHDFEYFCADILRKNGFNNVEVTQGSGDHGIDILAEKDDITYAIQCKCYSSNIGNAAVQQAHTGKSLYHRDVAVVMTNQYFTQQAQEEAVSLGVKLWDRDKLNEFIDKSNINI